MNTTFSQPRSKYSTLDLLDPVIMNNPYPLYERILNHTPYYWSDTLQSLVLLSYDAVSASYKNPEVGGMPRFPHPGMEELNRIIGNWLLDKVPPEHTRYRQMYNPHFGKDALLKYEQPIREITLDLLNKIKQNKVFDFIEDFAKPFPARIMAHILGCPLEDSNRMALWADSLYYCIGSTRYVNDYNYLQNARNMAMEAVQYFLKKIKEKRANPGDDLTSRLAEKSDGSQEMDYAFASELLLMITAGYITSRDQFGTGLLALLNHPDQFQAIVEDPSLLGPAIEEMLRYDSALHAPGHLAQTDLEIMGYPLKKGQSVVTIIGAANRDPAIFEDPASFNIFRKENPHIAFALGHHACMGSYLFRMEAKIVFEAIIDLIPHVKLIENNKPRYQTFSLLIRGLEKFPLQLKE